MNKINHEFTNNLVCPWCGEEDEGSWEYEPGEEDLGVIDCVGCEKPFHAERIFTTKYSTQKVALGTCQKCGEENVPLKSRNDTIYR